MSPFLKCLGESSILPAAFAPNWCPRRDSNPEPTDYESAALTVELQGHISEAGEHSTVAGLAGEAAVKFLAAQVMLPLRFFAVLAAWREPGPY